MSGAERAFSHVGMAVLAAASAWWAAVQLGLLAVPVGLPAGGVHALAMCFGFFPMFFAAFLFSRGLRWLHALPQPAALLRSLAGLSGAGWCVVAAGALTGEASWLVAGLGAAAASWSLAVAWLARLLLQAGPAAERGHMAVIVLAGAFGAATMWASCAAVAAGRWPLVIALAHAAVWGFVGLTFVAAAHRMLPLYGRPRLLPVLLAACLVAQAAASLFDAARQFAAAFGTAVGVLLLALAARWPFVHGLRPRLLRMLWAGFVWLGVALLLSSWPGNAPLHAFTAGFLGTTMLAMLSRVIAGAAGRAQVVDSWLWTLFLLLQAAVVLRVAAPLLGGAGATAAAALAWAAVWTAWGLRYGRMPRAQ